MRAIHLPTGVEYDANDVDPAGTEKAGPWACPTSGCTAVFKSHRRATRRRRAGEGEPTVVNATFVNRSADDHVPGCGNGISRPSTDSPGPVTLRNDVIHLDLDVSVRLRNPSGERGAGAQGAPRIDYRARVRTAREMRMLHDEMLANQAAMSEVIVCDGVQYRWWELPFGPETASLLGMKAELQVAFNSQGRPWLVRGVVAGPPRVTNTDKHHIILRGVQAEGLPETRDRVHLVTKKFTPVAGIVAQLQEGDRIAILTTKASISTYETVWVEIRDEAQLEVEERRLWR